MRNALAWLLVSLLPVALAAQSSERLKLVERYKKELKSRNAETRAEAAESLGNLKMAEAIEPLAAALGDSDPTVREAAASALWESSDVAKPAIPALRGALHDPFPSVVVRAAGALMAMDEEPSGMSEELRGALRRGGEVERFLAARALIGIDPADTLAGPIVDYLKRNAPDPHADDWSARSDNFESGTKALEKLAATNDRKAIAPLMSRVNETHLTKPILEALGKFQPPPDHWTDTLVRLLTSPVADVRETATGLLGEQTRAADVKVWAAPVSRLLSDKEKGVREDAIRALGNAKGLALDAIAPVVQAVKSDPDPELRARAAEAVGEIADAEFPIDTAVKAKAAEMALPILTAAAESDSDRDVRKNALASINRLQLEPATVVAILARAAVQQKDRNLRLDALQMLNNRGKEAAPVRAMIAPLANDPDELIRRVAEGALQAMSSDRFGTHTASTAKAADPAVRDKALTFLRENQYKFSDEAYFSALNEVELDIVKAFLDAGMSPNHKFAGSYGNPAMSVVLEADEGCSATVRPTPADTKAIVKLLLARGADVNITDDRGMTPLMVAAQNCDAEVIKILLGAKANMNAKNITGTTAFEFGLFNATDGAAAIAAAGFRLPPDKVKMYTESYGKDPKRLALVKKASAK